VKVLYEDNHLLVVDKPAGMPTMGAEQNVLTVHAWAVDYLRRRYDKPGKVFVGIVSRLDSLTSGVLVLARTSKAASRLSIQFGGPGKHKKVSRPAEKLYLALVEGDLEKQSGLSRSGVLSDLVFKDDAAHRMRVAKGPRRDGKQASLEYCIAGKTESATLVAVRLVTGRKHQIRLQFSDRGHPILGDRKYGAKQTFPVGLALHSWRLLITHPTKSTPMQWTAALPDSWRAAMRSLPSEEQINEHISNCFAEAPS
jgi:23S rRNA pseudouridine1911/1915/1917 synthase